MNRNNWLEREKNRLAEDIGTISSDLTRLFKSDILEGALPELIERQVISKEDKDNFQEHIKDTCNDIEDAIEKLIKPEQDEKRRYAFAAISSVAMLDSEVTWFISRIDGLRQAPTSIGQTATKIWNRLNTYIKPIILRISARLWQLISRLITPTSWTIQGDAGANLFSLKGNVGISITFGP